IRMFADNLLFLMDETTHGMIGYEGTVLVRGEKGETYNAVIEFEDALGIPPGGRRVFIPKTNTR
ncbi:MAG: hypothetical protein VX589_01000, partial [Myxococcota bacterium]|nr:hypothetical protein [Myxococcota bacterium]